MNIIKENKKNAKIEKNNKDRTKMEFEPLKKQNPNEDSKQNLEIKKSGYIDYYYSKEWSSNYFKLN